MAADLGGNFTIPYRGYIAVVVELNLPIRHGSGLLVGQQAMGLKTTTPVVIDRVDKSGIEANFQSLKIGFGFAFFFWCDFWFL